jgi:hypothetical protein
VPGPTAGQSFGGGLPTRFYFSAWLLVVAWVLRRMIWFRYEIGAFFLVISLVTYVRVDTGLPWSFCWLVVLAPVIFFGYFVRDHGLSFFRRRAIRRAFYRACLTAPYVSSNYGRVPKVWQVRSLPRGFSFRFEVPAGRSRTFISQQQVQDILASDMWVRNWSWGFPRRVHPQNLTVIPDDQVQTDGRDQMNRAQLIVDMPQRVPAPTPWPVP